MTINLGKSDLNADDIVELLNSHEELTVEDLFEICDQPINKNEDDIEEEDKPKLAQQAIFENIFEKTM